MNQREYIELVIATSALCCLGGVVLILAAIYKGYATKGKWLRLTEWAFLAAMLAFHISGVKQLIDVIHNEDLYQYVFMPAVYTRCMLLFITIFYLKHNLSK